MPRVYRSLPPAPELWDLYDYKPLTGELVRKRCVRGARAGSTVGSRDKDGYLVCGAHSYKVHRLIWKWVTGKEPILIDHYNNVRTDNSWHNLRAASETQNHANALVRRDSSTGLKGVQLPKGRTRYRAKIRTNGKQVYLGSFTTAEEAAAAYETAALALHGEFAIKRFVC